MANKKDMKYAQCHVENLHFCWKIAIPDTIVYRESYVIMLWTFCIDQFREYPHKKKSISLTFTCTD